ncbi:MAG: aminotransferase class V-fold PLP-dependent enzyme [Bacteroidota bacterium]|nr:aminotransferase class V-fold PLP-dependent enzyme [Bacteroidota bacterium]
MLDLDPETRRALWAQLAEVAEAYWAQVLRLPVSPRWDPEGLRQELESHRFEQPLSPEAVLRWGVERLREHQVHTPHPRYFGLFNPAPTPMGVAAEFLVALFNPQLAAWTHSPFAVELERRLVRWFGAQFGWPEAESDGVFTSGGAEANHTALLLALCARFSEVGRVGLRALRAQPVLYVSEEAHHSLLKAAQVSGLGREAVRVVPVTETLQFDLEALARQIAQDRRQGLEPFLLVGTAGTTAAGVIDPLEALADLAQAEGLWYHVDAAWAGAVALVAEYRPWLKGVERADSITFDPHKWLSVPMGAGLCLSRHPEMLERAFRVPETYMPREAASWGVPDPFARSLQWSRRFVGLKVWFSLMSLGRQGYETAIRHMVAMGHRLRQGLCDRGWALQNATPLPLACVVDPAFAEDAAHHEAIVRELIGSGRAWVSTARLRGHHTVIRACITNYRTGPEDVDALLEALDAARHRVRLGR